MSETKTLIESKPDIGEKEQEKKLELEVMKSRIERALSDPEIRKKTQDDFTYTFQQLGLSSEVSLELCNEIFNALSENKPLSAIETDMLHKLEGIFIDNPDSDDKKNLIEILHAKLKYRAELIFSQVSRFLSDASGRVIDFGAGDGRVMQLLHDALGLDIEGADVRQYSAPDVTVPIKPFDGNRMNVPDGFYDVGIMTNVAHHEKDNENILRELSRIIKKKLVVIETVPTGKTDAEIEKDRERTFMNDYLYNRLFHNADVPVPGTFEIPDGWVRRFAKYGWRVIHSENLGYDQPTIKDVHHLFVFEK
jgi:SAM-dependent methyltransferase